jgi:hypothetical protein
MTGSIARDFEDAKEEVLADALEDAEAGDQATAQTQGEIDHPHGDDDHTSGTIGTKEEDGSVSFDTGHDKPS